MELFTEREKFLIELFVNVKEGRVTHGKMTRERYDLVRDIEVAVYNRENLWMAGKDPELKDLFQKEPAEFLDTFKKELLWPKPVVVTYSVDKNLQAWERNAVKDQ